jgi:hypothetical protein
LLDPSAVPSVGAWSAIPPRAAGGAPGWEGFSTTLKNMFEGDLDAVAAGRHAEDSATFIETRSVYLAAAGEIA